MASSLKQELKKFLKNPDSKRSKLRLDANWGRILKLSDSKRNFFKSRLLKSLLKNEGEESSKSFVINLVNWNFVYTGSKDQKIDIEVNNYKILKRGNPDFSKRNQNLLELKEIGKLLESFKKNRTQRSRKSTPHKPKQTPRKKKIKKISEKTRSKKTDSKSSIDEETVISPEELISAPDYDFDNFGQDLVKERCLSGSKKKIRLPNPTSYLTKTQKQNYNKTLIKHKLLEEKDLFHEKVDPLLKNKPIKMKDILQSVKISSLTWNELNFNEKCLQTYLAQLGF